MTTDLLTRRYALMARTRKLAAQIDREVDTARHDRELMAALATRSWVRRHTDSLKRDRLDADALEQAERATAVIEEAVAGGTLDALVDLPRPVVDLERDHTVHMTQVAGSQTVHGPRRTHMRRLQPGVAR